MFQTLTDRFEGIFSRLRSKGRLSPADVDEVLAEIRTALLEADVNLDVVKAFQSRVRERCVGADLSRALSPAQQVVKFVHDELTSILGGTDFRLTYASRPPTVVLLAGLQGSGKTTAAGKLALWFKRQGRNPMLVGADLQRPAAVEQLRVLGGQAGVTVFSVRPPDGGQSGLETSDPVEVARRSLAEAQRLGRDVLVVDTAGRLTIDAEMMQQVRHISEALQPHYTFLVIDAMTGQDAVTTALSFHETLDLNGVILTKLDGDSRGGAALSVKEVVGKPIVFASTGEKLADFDQFHPDRMANRILGMGDMLTLIETAERTFDQEVAAQAAEKMMSGRLTLEDFLSQLQQLKKMGPLKGILGMMPGVPKEIKNADIDDRELVRVEAIIHSMTQQERTRPEIIDASRRLRIARGSGRTPADVNALLKQFKEMQKMMKSMGLSGVAARRGARDRKKGGKGRGSRPVRPVPSVPGVRELVGGAGATGNPGAVFPGLEDLGRLRLPD